MARSSPPGPQGPGRCHKLCPARGGNPIQLSVTLHFAKQWIFRMRRFKSSFPQRRTLMQAMDSPARGINRRPLRWTPATVGAKHTSVWKEPPRAKLKPSGPAGSTKIRWLLRLLRENYPNCRPRHLRSRRKWLVAKPRRIFEEPLRPLGAAVSCRSSLRKFQWRSSAELGLGGECSRYHRPRTSV